MLSRLSCSLALVFSVCFRASHLFLYLFKPVPFKPETPIMPKFPNSHFYGGKTTFGGANLRKNIRRLQTTPYSALSNVRSIEAKPATVNGKLSSAALNGDSHLSSRTKRVLECLEKTALPVSNCKRQRRFEPYIPPPATETTTKELLILPEKDKTENVNISSSKVPPKCSTVVHEEPPVVTEVISKFEEFKQKRQAEKSSKWTCSVCSVDNDLTDDNCLSCEEPNPKRKKESSKSVSKPSSVAPVELEIKFGFPITLPKIDVAPPLQINKKIKQTSPEPPSKAVSLPPALFSFGKPPVVSAAFSSIKTSSTFTFSPPLSSTTTATPAATTVTPATTKATAAATTTTAVATATTKELLNLPEKDKTENVIISSSKVPPKSPIIIHEEPPVVKKDVSSFNEFIQKRLAEKSSKWTCSVCSVDNDLTDDNCLSCEEPNPEKKKESSTTVSKPSSFPPVELEIKFGSPITLPKIDVGPPLQINNKLSINFSQASTTVSTTGNNGFNFIQAPPSLGQPASTTSVEANKQPSTIPSVQPTLFKFGQPPTSSASSTGSSGFNFSQTLPTSKQPIPTLSFGAATQPPTLPSVVANKQPSAFLSVDVKKQPSTLPPVQPTPFKFGQSSNNSVAASNTGFNFSQTQPTLGQLASAPTFGVVTQPAALPSVQSSLFTFGKPSNNPTAAVATGNSGFNFSQALPSLGQPASTPSFGAATQPPTLPSAQPTPFKFGQTSNSTVAAGNTGFNFSQALGPTLGQPASAPSFGVVTQPAALPSVQSSLFTFGQSSNNPTAAAATGNSGFNFGQAAVAPIGQSAIAPPFGNLFGASSTQPAAAAPPVIPAFGSTTAFAAPPVAAPQANSSYKFGAEPNLNFPAFSTPALGPLAGNAGNMFAFNATDQNTMPPNRQIKKAKRRLR